MWEDIIKNEGGNKQVLNALNTVEEELKSLSDSLAGFMADSDEKDGAYEEALDMMNTAALIIGQTDSLRGRIKRFLSNYDRLVRENAM